jgi:hypothetical protein
VSQLSSGALEEGIADLVIIDFSLSSRIGLRTFSIARSATGSIEEREKIIERLRPLLHADHRQQEILDARPLCEQIDIALAAIRLEQQPPRGGCEGSLAR